MQKKIMILGSGELAKEFVIAAHRLGQYTIAVDNYAGAPAMQVSHENEVIDMLNADELEKIVAKHSPDIIVPEIEAIRTEKLFEFEARGIQVVPNAKSVNYTMNRKAIRDLAHDELKVKTANYRYAKTLEELKESCEIIGYPCVIKPLMSSSGKGQSIVRSKDDIKNAWETGTTKSRGDINELIVEEFIKFDKEITLLTVTQFNNKTLFCPPIGHIQKEGDYRESWMPEHLTEEQFNLACSIAQKVTTALGGAGIWGIEFFIADNEVYFSELSPRPHDTGMVTLANTLNYNEFELHLRAILNLPINSIDLKQYGASAVILADREHGSSFEFTGIENALSNDVDIRIFGKPVTRKNRRMGVCVVNSPINTPIEQIRKKAVNAADSINIKYLS